MALRLVNITSAMPEEHGYTAGCSKHARVHMRRADAGSRHSEERCHSFKTLLRVLVIPVWPGWVLERWASI
eukprot:11103924-Alexandrium_andersonii.AAC.1